MNEAPDVRATREDADGRAYFAGLHDQQALARLHVIEDLRLLCETPGRDCPMWLTTWMATQRSQARHDTPAVRPSNDPALLVEAAAWCARLREGHRAGVRILAKLIDRLQDLCFERRAQDWRYQACWVCQHSYPALRLCSRCGPGCVACQQALDAARYVFLRTISQAYSPTMDGTSLWHVPSYAFYKRARSFNEAIDLAMRTAEEPAP